MTRKLLYVALAAPISTADARVQPSSVVEIGSMAKDFTALTLAGAPGGRYRTLTALAWSRLRRRSATTSPDTAAIDSKNEAGSGTVPGASEP